MSDHAPEQLPSDPGAGVRRRQQLEHHLRACPTDLDGYLELARIYRTEQRPVEARRVLEQARQVFPDEPRIVWELEEAILARSLQQLREVRELAERLRTPEAEHELDRARADWSRRRLEVCRARLGREPQRVGLKIAIAEALIDDDRYQEALGEVESLTDHEEFGCQAQLLRGRCFLTLGRDADALPALRAAALRRSLPPPPRVRSDALRLLVDTAERLGLALSLERYRQQLAQAEAASDETAQGAP